MKCIQIICITRVFRECDRCFQTVLDRSHDRITSAARFRQLHQAEIAQRLNKQLVMLCFVCRTVGRGIDLECVTRGCKILTVVDTVRVDVFD